MTFRSRTALAMFLLSSACAVSDAALPHDRDSVLKGVTQTAHVPPGYKPPQLIPPGYNPPFLLGLTPERQLEVYPRMEKYFIGQTAKRGPNESPLPIASRQIAPRITWLGQTYADVDAFMNAARMTGVLVLKNGEVVLERYALGRTASDRWTSFSVGKSVTALLVGAAIQDGYILSLDEGHRDTFTRELVSRYAPEGTFFDMTAFHVLSTESLAALQAAAPASIIASARFRPNLTIERAHAVPDFAENDWVGRVLWAGPDLAMKLLMPTMRCVMTTLAQESLPSDPDVLRALVRANHIEVPGGGRYPCIGVYGSLVRRLSTGGRVQRGDPCRLS
jgi:hypothetical protein